ncbi:ribonuclease HI [Brevibacterium paucivorans]|uniref:ribonuclease H n=1 Tax=Brevibacterium paucivorans TaxID=170994 RepID=A0ABS2SMI6_9MICO|nr:ribonuclease HI [Brevibacterium paucivorans]
MLEVACDGSALGNPGPAGWAWVIDDKRWAAGGWEESTNNRAELQAVIEILKATAHTHEDLLILADSKYVINSVTKWMPVWRLKGWKKANGQDVLNRDLMEELWEQVDALEKSGRKLKFQWVKGHSNHELNEAADQRARAVATAIRDKGEPDLGPGLGTGEKTEVTGQPVDTVNVWCPLEKDLADQIVERAKALGLTPHALLAQVIEVGWKEHRDSGK